MSDISSRDLVDPKTLEFRRAIKDPAEAFSMYRRLVTENKLRTSQNAAIQRKLNDEQPWNPRKLTAAGESWRHNRSTGFMPSLIKRILPPYKQVIDTARVLTLSELPGDSLDDKQKSEDFQMETTKCMRRWSGWHDLWTQIINEDVTFGSCSANWSDEFDWKPTFMRTDDALFPDGCPQDAEECPMFARRQYFQIHELADKLVDPKVSEDVGWNIENLVSAINAAQPENRRKGNQDNLRKFEDTIREATVGRSYSQGVKAVEAAHLFVKEANGKISHYILDANTGKDLMTHLDRFDCMEECLTLFSIEVGNGKLYGSKGAGRVLYNTHVAIEQARNLIADNLYLSSLLLLKSKQKSKQSVAITVTHPVCVVGEDYDVVEHQFQVNADAFFALDNHMTKIAEMQVGAFMPGLLSDDNQQARTASEVNYVASVEQQIKEGILSRFWGQSLKMIYQMQVRIFNEDNIQAALQIYKETQGGILQRVTSKFMAFITKIGMKMNGTYIVEEKRKEINQDAIECCLCLLKKGLTADEIYRIAQVPPNSVSDEMTARTNQAIDMVVTRYRGDPKINQQRLMDRDIGSKLGNTIATDLIIPEEDNTLTAEATRMQLLELTSLMTGDPVPISPRDIDEIHMQVIEAKAQDLVKTMTPESITPDTLKIAGNVLTHFDSHLQSALSKGTKKEQLVDAINFSTGVHQLIDKLQGASGTGPQSMLQAPEGSAPSTPAPGAANGPVTLPGGPSEIQPIPKIPIPGSGNMPLAKGPADLTPTVT